MSDPAVPVGPDDVTAGWVSEVLARIHDIGPVVRIGEDYGFASELYRVETSGDDVERLIVKLWDTTTSAGIRELQFYEHLAEKCPIPLPVFRAGGVDVTTDRAFLIFDELVDFRQGDVSNLESRTSLLSLAETLARFHARWWEAGELAEHSWLIEMQIAVREPRWFTSRTTMFLERFGPLSHPVATEVFAHLAEAHALANEVVREAPPTLLHGDHHLDNIMFPTEGTPVFLDWAGVGRGPGVLDLVNLAFRMGETTDAEAALDGYFATLRRHGVKIDKDGWLNTVSAALLRQFTNWTLGMAAVQMPTERGSAQVLPGIVQAEAALVSWYERHPDLIDATIGP